MIITYLIITSLTNCLIINYNDKLIKKEELNNTTYNTVNNLIKEITSKDDIELVFDILANLNEGTESINDFPVNATKIVKIDLIYSKGNAVVFAYMRDDKYYLETPYGGTFLTTEENYNKINDIFNRAE